MAPNGLLCADVPLRNYSLTHSLSHTHPLSHSLTIISMLWHCQLGFRHDIELVDYATATIPIDF